MTTTSSTIGSRILLRMARTFKTAPLSAKIGIIIIAAYTFIAVMAPILAPFGEATVVGAQFEPWSRTNWLGTDNLGRDMYTRLLFAARNTIGIALLTTLLAFAIGILRRTAGCDILEGRGSGSFATD